MPLRTKKAGDCRGTEANGSKSDTYCSLCYKNGKFRQPKLKFDDMKQIVEEALIKEGWPKPLRWLAKRQLPRLERWKQK